MKSLDDTFGGIFSTVAKCSIRRGNRLSYKTDRFLSQGNRNVMNYTEMQRLIRISHLSWQFSN